LASSGSKFGSFAREAGFSTIRAFPAAAGVEQKYGPKNHDPGPISTENFSNARAGFFSERLLATQDFLISSGSGGQSAIFCEIQGLSPPCRQEDSLH
jgi:hypothetical protein